VARNLRTLLLTTATAASTLLVGTTAVGAVPQLPPGITLPPRPSDATSTTTTVAPATTVAPTTVPETTAPPAPAPETKIILVDPPKEEAKVGADPPAGGGPAGQGDAGTTTTTATSTTTTTPPSLSAGQVDAVLRDQQRSGANSTAALVEALKPLQALGMTAQEALMLGMGRFPLLGVANWTDDWLDPRSGPPVHQHMGNDLFAAFDTPVRAPADGVVRFTDGGLGGLGAYVTTPDGTYYYMAHLKAFNRDIANGATVKLGQVVGFNGDSGNAKGGAPHVHFEIHPTGGGAVNPKPILDAWVAEAVAKVPELLASFQPKAEAGAPGDEAGGVPQILVATGLTRRFSAPARTEPAPTPDSFYRAVLGPLTPPALAPLLDMPLAEL
jgi:murein DD-endopeptidase MepM/ murein hydrolase activator NlpD